VVLADLVAGRARTIHPSYDASVTITSSGRDPIPGQVLVGFAAETGDEQGSVLDHARAKLVRKGCDLLVVNDVGGGAVFGSEDNEAVVLAADGSSVSVPLGSKAALAHVIWDRVLTLRRTEPMPPAPDTL